MGSSFAQALSAMLLIASMVAVCTANKDWKHGNYSTGWGSNHGPYHLNSTNEPNKIVVGGSDWHYGFNYADWSLKSSSIYVQDTLGQFNYLTFLCSSNYIDSNISTSLPVNFIAVHATP